MAGNGIEALSFLSALRASFRCFIFIAIVVSASTTAKATRLIRIIAESDTADVVQNFVSVTNSVLKNDSGVDVVLELSRSDQADIIKRLQNGDWTAAILSPDTLAAQLSAPPVGVAAPIMSVTQPLGFRGLQEVIDFQNGSEAQFVLDSLGRHNIIGISFINIGASQILTGSRYNSFNDLRRAKPVIVTSHSDAILAQDFSFSPIMVGPEQALNWIGSSQTDSIVLNTSVRSNWQNDSRLEKYNVTEPLQFNMAVAIANAQTWYGIPFPERESVSHAIKIAKAQIDEQTLKAIDKLPYQATAPVVTYESPMRFYVGYRIPNLPASGAKEAAD
jgi:hypothetical protein